MPPVVVEPVVAQPAVVEPRAPDADRARIASYLEQALTAERLGPGEHAARTPSGQSVRSAHMAGKAAIELAGGEYDIGDTAAGVNMRAP